MREVYWHVLAHGFAGQYYFENGDDGELGKLKTLHGRQLRSPPLDLATLAEDHITPQPYAMPDPPGPRDPLQRERLALRAVADVRGRGDRASPRRDDGGGGLLRDVAVEIAQDDAGPALRQELAVRPAHAARPARHDGDAAGERQGRHADAAAAPVPPA